jgi:bacteriocin-like protein
MNQNKKKNKELVLAKFATIELTKEELRTIEGGGTPVDAIIKPKGDKI